MLLGSTYCIMAGPAESLVPRATLAVRVQSGVSLTLSVHAISPLKPSRTVMYIPRRPSRLDALQSPILDTMIVCTNAILDT